MALPLLPLEPRPVETPLPAAPAGDFMNETQWEVLWALLDGVTAAVVPASATTDKASQISLPDEELQRVISSARETLSGRPLPGDGVIEKFLSHRPSQDPAFREDILRTLCISPQRDKLAKALGFLATRAGSLLLTGYWSPVHQQPTHVREAIVKSWVNSSLLNLRNLAKTMITLAQKANAVTSPYFDQLLGYTDVPKDWKAGSGYQFNFVQAPRADAGAGDEPHVITTDVVIVGSGCGGAVCARNLAEAGRRVLVVDKGYYFPPAQLPMSQAAAVQYLFDHGGVYMTEDSGGVGVVCGGAWGGGGTVNWSVCLKLQDNVRNEWADSGLPFFASEEFDECMERVCGFVGATTDGIRQNHRGRVLLDGCEKLGWKAAPAPQNTAGKDHYCGQCHLGCGSAAKQGPVVSWLPAAAEAGAEFMEGFQVDKVLFDDDGETAVGIEGLWTSRGPSGEVHTPLTERVQRRVVVKASKVIISAGSLWSPLLLMKSGIQNQHLGEHLHIHPCNTVSAVYSEETRPWEGSAITSYSTEFENLDEEGYGVKLETMCMVPYTIMAAQPWAGSLDAKLRLLGYPHMAGFISLTRDRDGGRVFPDPTHGSPRIDYTVSDLDREHALEGLIALTKICYVTGAKEIHPFIAGLGPFIRANIKSDDDGDRDNTENQGSNEDPEFSDPEFASWLGRIRQIGNKPPTAMWTSAHQMGTCRMGATSDDGVVDDKGRVWGTKNLLVADASVFPTASGVNPMITVMAIADWISRGVVEDQ